MRALIVGLSCLILCGVAFSQYGAKSFQEIQQQRREEADRKRQEALSKKESEKKQTKSPAADSSKGPESQGASSSAKLKSLETKIWRLEYFCKQAGIDTSPADNDAIWPSEKLGELKLGKIGYFREPDRTEVFQIRDKMNMICKVTTIKQRVVPIERPATYSESRTATGANQGPSVATQPYPSDDYVCIKGVDTAGKVDGKPIVFDQPFCVTGTTQYSTTDGGTKTIFVLEPAELPKVQYLKK